VKNTLLSIINLILHLRYASVSLISVFIINMAKQVSDHIQDTFVSLFVKNCSKTELTRFVFIYGLQTASYHISSPSNL